MIKPLSNFIALVQIPNQSAMGIIFNEKESVYATVSAVNKEESDIHVNDMVIFRRGLATEVNYQGQKCLIVSKSEILAVITDE